MGAPELRIASLVPSSTELVCALGLAPYLVARTGFCTHPKALLENTPKVGGTKDVNLQRLQLLDRVELQRADLFPPGRAPLVVCNPPWVPARANSPIEHAVYDEGSRMLKGFLAGLPEHLEPGGEGWLILSDLAEHLGLRPREQLLAWIAEAGLEVRGRHDVKPVHAKAADGQDALHAARAAEVTSLWRLAAA